MLETQGYILKFLLIFFLLLNVTPNKISNKIAIMIFFNFLPVGKKSEVSSCLEISPLSCREFERNISKQKKSWNFLSLVVFSAISKKYKTRFQSPNHSLDYGFVCSIKLFKVKPQSRKFLLVKYSCKNYLTTNF